MKSERELLEETIRLHEETRRKWRRLSERRAPKAAAQALPPFAEQPAAGWVECPECHERFASLPDSGICLDCTPPPEPVRPITSRRRALLGAGVPERFADLEFLDPDPWPRVKGLDQSLDKWAGLPELLTFAGPTDTGKTTLAVEMLWRHPGRRAWTVAGRIPALLIHGEAGEWQRLTEADVLLVDELGRGHNRDGWEYVYGVVAERWNWRRPTILTTNLSLGQLEEAHPALYRRLQEGWIVPLGRNWRTRTKEAK